MKLDEYQEMATSTAIYPGTLAYPTLGLCGEAGELSVACKSVDDDPIHKELGDVLWYVANVADDAGLKLSEVCARKTFRFTVPTWQWTGESCQEICVAAGVVAENVKKTLRDNDGVLTDDRRYNIQKALKQIVVALANVASKTNSTLEACAKMNIDKLMSRRERGTLKGDGDDR